MTLSTIKLILCSFMMLWDQLVAAISDSNPGDLPIIATNLDIDVIPQPHLKPGVDNILQFSGESSIVRAYFTEITLTCKANYPIRWDSTIPAESYSLPKRFMEGNEDGPDGLPKHFRYETSVKLRTNPNKPGSVLCLKLGDPKTSSELMIHPANAGVSDEVKTLREGRTFGIYRRSETCPGGSYRPKNSKHWYGDNPSFQVYERFGLVVKASFNTVDLYEFCLGPLVVSFWFRGLQGYTYTDVVPKLSDFLDKRAPRCEGGELTGCHQWFCSNPFHCIIAAKTGNPALHCAIGHNSSKQQYECTDKGRFWDDRWVLNVHLYAGINERGVQPHRYAYFHTKLMEIVEPPQDQMVATERVTYACSAVSFLLGDQIVFGIRFWNNSIKYMDSFSKPEITENKLQDGEISFRTMDLTLELGMIEVICMAPQFDSEQWYKITAKISLIKSDAENGVNKTVTERITTKSKTSATPNIGGEEEPFWNTVVPTRLPERPPSTRSGDKKTSIITDIPSSTLLTSTSGTELTTTGLFTAAALPEQTLTSSATTGSTITASIGEEQGYKGGDGKDSDVTVILAACAGVALFAMFLIAGTCVGLRYVKLNKSLRALTEEEIEQFRRGIYRASVVRSSVALGLTYQTTHFENEISEADIQIEHGNIIEQDAFVSVFPGTIKGRKAIVKTTDEKTTTLFFIEFLKDIKIMNHISVCSHPNIVGFLGAVTPNIQNRIICAGYEASSLGTLKDFLRSESTSCINLIPGNPDTGSVTKARYTSEVNHNEVTTLMMLLWCDQITAAMAFLHKENLVHGDLSASNVLLFPENCVKISDLSLWRKQYERDFYLANYKPPPKWRWLAIELFRSKKFTIKSDVWAFGVTLWEIFSLGEDPHPGIKWSPDFVLKLEGGYRMDKPSRVNQDIYQLLLCCWYRYPNDRPSFGEIKERICEFIKRLQ